MIALRLLRWCRDLIRGGRGERLSTHPLGKREARTPWRPAECKSANITAFRKFYRIHSWAVYGASKIDPDGFDVNFPADLDDLSLGVAARNALLASRFIPPEHPDWDRVSAFWKSAEADAIEERLLARAGVKTAGALYRGVGSVGLHLQDRTITLKPWKYVGRGGFGPIPGMEPTRLPETVSDEEFGATIRYLVGISRKPWTRP